MQLIRFSQLIRSDKTIFNAILLSTIKSNLYKISFRKYWSLSIYDWIQFEYGVLYYFDLDRRPPRDTVLQLTLLFSIRISFYLVNYQIDVIKLFRNLRVVTVMCKEYWHGFQFNIKGKRLPDEVRRIIDETLASK